MLKSTAWLDQLIHPGGRTGQELRDWLVENEDEYIKNGFHVDGGPTVEYGGFLEDYTGVMVADGTFVPGVIEVPDGKVVLPILKILARGHNSIPYMPYVASYPWQFTRPSMFDADFIKLREISLSYQIPLASVIDSASGYIRLNLQP